VSLRFGASVDDTRFWKGVDEKLNELEAFNYNHFGGREDRQRVDFGVGDWWNAQTTEEEGGSNIKILFDFPRFAQEAILNYRYGKPGTHLVTRKRVTSTKKHLENLYADH